MQGPGGTERINVANDQARLEAFYTTRDTPLSKTAELDLSFESGVGPVEPADGRLELEQGELEQEDGQPDRDDQTQG